MKRNRNNPPAPRAAGFTLMELVFAMAILAVGLSVAASMFPTATFLQRRAFEVTVSREVGRSAAAMLRADPVARESSGSVVPASVDDWPLADRSYPQAGGQGAADRQFYWIPLAATLNGEQRVFAFVCRRVNDVDDYTALTGDAEAIANPSDDPATAPRVARFSVGGGGSYDPDTGRSVLNLGDVTDEQYVEPGDPMLTDTGAVLRVVGVDGDSTTVLGDARGANAVWIGLTHQKGMPGPGRHIEPVGPEAMQ